MTESDLVAPAVCTPFCSLGNVLSIDLKTLNISLSEFMLSLLVLFYATVSCCVAPVDFKLTVLVPWSPEC